jgi:hypothetical protein
MENAHKLFRLTNYKVEDQLQYSNGTYANNLKKRKFSISTK